LRLLTNCGKIATDEHGSQGKHQSPTSKLQRNSNNQAPKIRSEPALKLAMEVRNNLLRPAKLVPLAAGVFSALSE
jgi:hypothetical protein